MYNFCYFALRVISDFQPHFFSRLKFDFLQYEADCYFFNQPIKDDIIFTDLIKKIINATQNKISALLIFVNCNNDILKSLKNIHLIETYYINGKKGFSIYRVNNK